MRHITGVLIFLAAPMQASLAQTTVLPEALSSAQTQLDPYRYNGLLSTDNAIGSASMVEAGVFVTAAHVVFDDDSLRWTPINQVRYHPQWHETLPIGSTTGSYQSVGFFRWTSYATRVENDPSGTGYSSPDTFNIDFAAGYLNRLVSNVRIMAYAEVSIDAEESVSVLRDNRDKMIVGYPADKEAIPASNVGLMHATAPGDYFCFWSGLEDFPNETWRDSEDFWVATYEFEGVNTYSGNSGGPMYVKDDEGKWTIAGILVGSVGSTGVLVRGIDENAWDWISQAIAARGTSRLRRVTDLSAVQVGSSNVLLEWSDLSTGEDAWRIYRLDDGLWELLDTLPADRSSYADLTLLPGQVYRYRVQPVGNNGATAPKSPPVTVVSTGRSSVAADHFGQPWLAFVTEGDSNWFVDAGNRLRAGKVRSLGLSSLRLDIIGPGTLDFTWSVSSEVNPDYNTPGSTFKEIYDAAFLFLNGEKVKDGDESVFLSGFISPTERQLVLPAGNHTVEWIYQKDPYSSEGDDTAFLDALIWTPGPAAPYPVLGAFAHDDPAWHGSTWFGDSLSTSSPWVWHSELGWLYLRPGNGQDLFFQSIHPQLDDLYTRPDIFPWVYHIGRETWLYYYRSSGSFGQRLWFYDTREKAPFRVN